jgi:hypothetical protein
MAAECKVARTRSWLLTSVWCQCQAILPHPHTSSWDSVCVIKHTENLTFTSWLMKCLLHLHVDAMLYHYYYYYGSTVLCCVFAYFSVSWSYTQSIGFLGRGISPSQCLYLHTEKHKHRINAYNTDIHALSGNRTHDPSVRASEDSSCLRPHGYRNLHA